MKKNKSVWHKRSLYAALFGALAVVSAGAHADQFGIQIAGGEDFSKSGSRRAFRSLIAQRAGGSESSRITRHHVPGVVGGHQFDD